MIRDFIDIVDSRGIRELISWWIKQQINYLSALIDNCLVLSTSIVIMIERLLNCCIKKYNFITVGRNPKIEQLHIWKENAVIS